MSFKAKVEGLYDVYAFENCSTPILKSYQVLGDKSRKMEKSSSQLGGGSTEKKRDCMGLRLGREGGSFIFLIR